MSAPQRNVTSRASVAGVAAHRFAHGARVLQVAEADAVEDGLARRKLLEVELRAQAGAVEGEGVADDGRAFELLVRGPLHFHLAGLARPGPDDGAIAGDVARLHTGDDAGRGILRSHDRGESKHRGPDGSSTQKIAAFHGSAILLKASARLPKQKRG